MDGTTVGADLAVAELGRQLTELAARVQELTAQTTYLVERTRQAELRQREWDDLKHDATPVVSDLYCVAVEQLAEIEPHVRPEEILYLLKRIARNIRMLTAMVDRLESLNDLIEDAAPLANDVFTQTVAALDTMERQGYFRLGREALRVAEQAAGAVDEADLRHLGDNIGPVLGTVKELMQPDVMGLMGRLVATYRDAPPGRAAEARSVSLLSLIRQLNDPEVRCGLALLLALLKTVAQQPERRNGRREAVRGDRPG